MGDLTETLLKSPREPGHSRLQCVGIIRLEYDFNVGPVCAEAWIRAYTDSGVNLYCLGKNCDDLALGRAVAAAPRTDRRTGSQLLLNCLVDRLHLRRQAREDVDVLEHEPGRAAERVRERPAAGGEPGPAGRVLGVASKTRAQVRCDLFVLDLLDAEGCCQRLTRDVVGRTAEAAGDDDEVGPIGLLAQRRRDLLDLVRHDCDQADVDAGSLEPARE